jgi:uncharacterized protein
MIQSWLIMTTISPLAALMPEKRGKILTTTFMHPEKSWYLRELARTTKIDPSNLQRELEGLTSAGILERTVSGNRVYFKANEASPIFEELRGLVRKTAGVVDVLREVLLPFKKRIKLAFVYGSIASGTEGPDSDVDVFIVGNVALSEIVPILSHAEEQIGREINPVIMTLDEVQEKTLQHNNFLLQVSNGEKLPIIGEARDTERLFKQD